MEKKIDRYEIMNKHKKNGGFSLVELIVVVLIMAIIATALTLAVTKYVARAKRSSDVNTAGELKSAMEMAIMDVMTGASNAAIELPSGTVVLEYDTSDMKFDSSSSLAASDLTILEGLLKNTLGDGPIYSKVHPSESFVVKVEKTVKDTVEIKVTYSVHSTDNPFDFTY